MTNENTSTCTAEHVHSAAQQLDAFRRELPPQERAIVDEVIRRAARYRPADVEAAVEGYANMVDPIMGEFFSFGGGGGMSFGSTANIPGWSLGSTGEWGGHPRPEGDNPIHRINKGPIKSPPPPLGPR